MKLFGRFWSGIAPSVTAIPVDPLQYSRRLCVGTKVTVDLCDNRSLERFVWKQKSFNDLCIVTKVLSDLCFSTVPLIQRHFRGLLMKLYGRFWSEITPSVTATPVDPLQYSRRFCVETKVTVDLCDNRSLEKFVWKQKSFNDLCIVTKVLSDSCFSTVPLIQRHFRWVSDEAFGRFYSGIASSVTATPVDPSQ